jgi:hypothetical protein
MAGGAGLMHKVCVRLSDSLVARLDGLAGERAVNRTRLVRQLLEPGLQDRPAPRADSPTEDELLMLLAEKARQGNVAAIRSLLAREELSDPRSRAIALFSEIVADRQP